VPFNDFRSDPQLSRMRLTCDQWRPGGSHKHAQLAHERATQKRADNLTAEDTARAWKYARDQRCSFAQAVIDLFEQE
jgi:hypothetical protein